MREKTAKKIKEVFETNLIMVELTLDAFVESCFPMNSEMYFVPAIGSAKGAITLKIA